MSYQFQFDWFSPNIPFFEKHLSHLGGTDCRILEIGTHEGRSATWMLENIATAPGSRIDCVDAFEQPNLRANLKASGGLDRTRLIIELSKDALNKLEPSTYDFVYIDGYHGRVEVLEDGVLSFRLAKIGAILCFDDYLWTDPNFDHDGVPKQSVDYFIEIYRDKIEVLDVNHQVWIRKISD